MSGCWSCGCRRTGDGWFSKRLFERYQRSEKALVAALAEMYVQGSPRNVKAITEELCGHALSALAISGINETMDAELAAFAERQLKPYPTCPSMRDTSVREGQAVLIAVGIDWEGRRNVLGGRAGHRESGTSWKDFLLGLKERGLNGVKCTVSDDHEG